MKYTKFSEDRFRESVDKAMKRVEQILEHTRHPRLAEDEEHTYDDKFAMVDFLTNTSIASQMNALERLGLDTDKFRKVSGWVHDDKQTVTLRFKAKDTCAFLKEREIDIVTGEKIIEQETTEANASSGFFASAPTKTEKVTAKVIAKVKEYHWKVELSYAITIYAGSDPTKNVVELDSRTSSTIIIVAGGQARPGEVARRPPPPIKEVSDHPPIDANITWFIQMIQPEEQICQFKVERYEDNNNDDGNNKNTNASINQKAKASCKTPRRNDDVDAAYEFNTGLYNWSMVTQGFFLQRVEKDILSKHSPVDNKMKANPPPASEPDTSYEPGTRATITGLQKEPAFNGKYVTILEYSQSQNRYKVEPIDKGSGLPGTLLIKPVNLKMDAGSSPHGPPLSGVAGDTLFCPVIPLMENNAVLSTKEVGDFLTEQSRSLDEAIDDLTKSFPPRQLVRLVSVAEATVVLLCQHLQDLAASYQDSVDYIENMLKQQLIQAIGKEIQSKDFDQFMVFHNERLFSPKYSPKPFTYAIRRPGYYPDGILTIECTKHKNEPIHTWVRHVSGGSASPSIHIPLNAATSVEMTGDRYLHGWMQHRFKTKPKNEFQLIARARQFSSFVLILGTMIGPDKFDPKDAIILQNKDEILIPLLTNTLPSAKEFKDAIASLSPEQQAFARSFRQMQLESSVFAVCVIQVKPQLEKLLGLPDGALTKEIQLTQDLMSLFVEYQIPSDLMSFDGDVNTDIAAKISAVKGYVKSIMDVIESTKEKQLVEEERKADMHFEMASASAARPGLFGAPAPSPFGAAAASIPLSSSAAVPYGAPPPFGSPPPPGGSPQPNAMPMHGMMMRSAKASPSGGRSGSSRSLTKRLQQQAPRRPSASESVPVRLESIQPTSKDSPFSSDPMLGGDTVGEDFTLIPQVLDTCIEKFDSDHALRSTIIKPDQKWTLMRQANLLTPIRATSLSEPKIQNEKKMAFDLLDAITRSGLLPIECSELHVVIGVSHCFDNDVMGSVVQDNINPIEKVERSGVMIASAINSEPPKALIQSESQLERLSNSFPRLFEAGSLQQVTSGSNHGEPSIATKGVSKIVKKLNNR